MSAMTILLFATLGALGVGCALGFSVGWTSRRTAFEKLYHSQKELCALQSETIDKQHAALAKQAEAFVKVYRLNKTLMDGQTPPEPWKS